MKIATDPSESAFFFRDEVCQVKGLGWDFERSPESTELQFGENQEGIPGVVVDSLLQHAQCLNKYPSLLPVVIDKIAEVKQIPSRNLVLVNGADEAFRLLAEAYIKPEDQCLMFPPTYPSIESAVKLMGGDVVQEGLQQDFSLPPMAEILEATTPRTKLVYIANPNVPTGNLVADEEQIRCLLDLPVIVLVDECYYELSGFSVCKLVDEYSNLIVLRSFSKTYALAGARMGYIVACEQTAQALGRIGLSLEPFHPTLSMAAVLAALEHEDLFKESLARLKAARRILRNGLQQLGLRVYPSDTTALLVDTASLDLNAEEFVRALRKEGVIVKTCEVYDLAEETWVYFGVPRLGEVDSVLQKAVYALVDYSPASDSPVRAKR